MKKKSLRLSKKILSLSLASLIVISGIPVEMNYGNSTTAYAADASEEKEYTVGNSNYVYGELDDRKVATSVENKKTLVDDATGIKIILPEDYKANVYPRIEQITDATLNKNIILEDNVEDYRIYDISLVDSKGKEVVLNKEVTIMIPEPNWNVDFGVGFWDKLGKIDDNFWGGYKSIDEKCENGYRVFNTNELGIYALRLYTDKNPDYSYSYKILDNNCVEIISCDMFYKGEEFIIPKIIRGRKVTSIGEKAFLYVGNPKKIVIPDTITNIGDEAFGYCKNLESIEIPDGVTNIGKRAFTNCENLKTVEISDGVTNIGNNAFQMCINLETVKLSNNITKIESDTFWQCKKLKYIDMPDSVVSIETSAFYASGLENIKIPKCISNIADDAFENCNSLRNIDVDKRNKQYTSKDGVLFNKKMDTLIKYPPLKEDRQYNIPNSVKYIGDAAFESCKNIESIKLPDDIKKIGESAFSLCTSLKSLKLPKGIECIEKCTFEFCENLTKVEIPSGVKEIGIGAFADCTKMSVIEIPDSIKKIGYDAFYNCNNLVLYGEKGSAIEAYAKENNIPFVISSKLYDDSTCIEVEFQAGDKKDGVSLKTKLLSKSDEQYKNIILTDNIVDTSIKPEDLKLNAYDITLVDENNNQVQPTKSVTVRIHCPDGYNGAKCKVYRVEGKGKYKDMNAKYSDGYLYFNTNHFSTYLITNTELVTDDGKDVTIGDANGDGQINTQDAVLIKKYLAEYDNVDIDLEASDVNGDGSVTSADAVLLLKYLAEYDVMLGK